MNASKIISHVRIALDNGLSTARRDFVDSFFFVNNSGLDIGGYSRSQDGVLTYEVSVIHL